MSIDSYEKSEKTETLNKNKRFKRIKSVTDNKI